MSFCWFSRQHWRSILRLQVGQHCQWRMTQATPGRGVKSVKSTKWCMFLRQVDLKENSVSLQQQWAHFIGTPWQEVPSGVDTANTEKGTIIIQEYNCSTWRSRDTVIAVFHFYGEQSYPPGSEKRNTKWSTSQCCILFIMESNHTLQRRKLQSGAQVNAAYYLSWRAIILSREENFQVEHKSMLHVIYHGDGEQSYPPEKKTTKLKLLPLHRFWDGKTDNSKHIESTR